MKKIILSVVALLTIVLMNSCSENFKLDAPYKNYTVVFSMLDMKDTAHYIRIQKAFLSENKSAYDMAKATDSNFYPVQQLSVVMKVISNSGSSITEIPLTRVDLNQEGYIKDSGTFFNDSNFAYKFTGQLDASALYRVVITNLASGEVDSAETYIIDDVTSNSFYILLFDNFAFKNEGIDFNSTLPSAEFGVDGTYTPPNGQTVNPVKLLEAVIRFNWVDSNLTTGTQTPRHADYSMGDQLADNNGGFHFSVKDLDLYQFLSSGAGMGNAPVGVARLIDTCDFFVSAASADYYNYQLASAVLGVGLTGDEIQPNVTNVHGTKGATLLGLFTDKGTRQARVPISVQTIDSLLISPILANAGIHGIKH